MGNSIEPIGLVTPDGVEDAFQLEIRRAPIDRTLIRMTKGFLSLLYPSVNRNALTFRVTPLDQFKVNNPAFTEIRPAFFKFERGDGVYQCWHAVESYSQSGIWVHMFFDSAWYMVDHASDRKIVLPW